MRHPPELVLAMAPFAVVSGFALSRAASTGATWAWCLATACGVVCLCGLIAAIQYLRFAKTSGRTAEPREYFEKWPRELDILLRSSAGSEHRALAAAELDAWASVSNWPYREDTINVLEHLIENPGTANIVKASALGTLASFAPDVPPSAIAAAMLNPEAPSYVRCAAMLLLARHPGTHSVIERLTGIENEDLLFFALPALRRAAQQARSNEQVKNIIVSTLARLRARTPASTPVTARFDLVMAELGRDDQ